MHGHRERVSSVAYSPDDRVILSGSYDNTIRLWHGTTGEELAECDCGQKSRQSAPSGLDVDLLIILDNYQDVIEAVAFSPDGRRCISGSRDATIRLWDVQTRVQLAVMLGHSEFISSVSYSPDGRAIASGSADSTVRLWDAETGSELAILRGHNSTVTSVTFSPDGRHLASASIDGTVRIWKLESTDEVFVFGCHQNAVSSVAYSPDGARLVSGSSDNTARVWSQTGAELAVVGADSWVRSVTFAPDGNRVALGLMDNSVQCGIPEPGDARSCVDMKGLLKAWRSPMTVVT